MVDFDPVLITAMASVALSILFERVPGFATWFDKKDSAQKRFLMTIMLLLTAAGVLIWNCSGTPQGFMVCMGAMNWKTVVMTFLSTLINQPAHRLTKKPDETDSNPPASVVDSKVDGKV